jgi:hypothetical protein
MSWRFTMHTVSHEDLRPPLPGLGRWDGEDTKKIKKKIEPEPGSDL